LESSVDGAAVGPEPRGRLGTTQLQMNKLLGAIFLALIAWLWFGLGMPAGGG
jgi:hypothetical protein